MFDKVRQINELRKQSKQLEAVLAQEVIEVVHKGVTVRISADMQIISLDSGGQVNEIIVSAINKSIKEAQKVAAKHMRGQLGNLGIDLPGF